MPVVRILSTVNWVLIGLYGVSVVWALLQPVNPYNDGGGREQETALKSLAVLLLLVVVVLNGLPYQWTKIGALLLVVSLLLLVRYVATH